MSLPARRAIHAYSRLADEVTDRVCELMDHHVHPEDARRNVDLVLQALADVRAGTRVYVPSEALADRANEILAAIAEGADRAQVCREFEISRRTFYRYRSMLRPVATNAELTGCGPGADE